MSTTISGVSSYDELYRSSGIYGIQGIQGIDSTQSTSSSDQSSGIQYGEDQANFSAIGKMMSQLSQLQSSDPDTFKELAQKISDDLAQEAQSCGDSQQSSMLSEMSDKFSQAAQSGTMDSLQPSQDSDSVYSASGGYGTKRSGRQGGGGALGEASGIISQDLSGVASNASLDSSSTSQTDPMQLLAQLQSLSTSDPTKFKEVTQQIADDLSKAASDSTDSKEGEMLSDLADKFSEAAQSGTMDSLQPPAPPSGQGGSGTGSGDSSSSSDSSDSDSSSTTTTTSTQKYDLLALLRKIMANDLSTSLSNTYLDLGSSSSAS